MSDIEATWESTWESTPEEPTRPVVGRITQLVKDKGPKIDTTRFPNIAALEDSKKQQGQGTRPPLTAFEQDLSIS